MSEHDVTPVPREEGSQVQKERTIETVTAEIKDLQKQAGGVMTYFAVEIGRRLCEAKEMLPHGEWGIWLRDQVDFSQRTANNLMLIFREYGGAQLSIFGAVTNSQAIANLPYTKALQLLAVPEEEREEFAKEVRADEISSRELDRLIREKKQLEEEKADAKAEAEKADAEAEEAKKSLSEAEMKLEAARSLLEEKERLIKESDERRKKDIEAAGKEIREEYGKKLEKSSQTAEAEKKKAVEEAREAMKDQIEDAKNRVKEAEDEVIALKKAAEEARKEAERQRIEAEAIRRQSVMSSPEITEFKYLFGQVQGTLSRMRELYRKVAEKDADSAGKLSAAMKAMIDKTEKEWGE